MTHCAQPLGFNHNAWHKVVIKIDQLSANLSVAVDEGHPVILELKSLTDGEGDRLLESKGTRRTGVLSVGGVKPGSALTLSQFIGCIKDVVLVESEGREFTCPVTLKDDVDVGCVDRCENDRPCQHHGLTTVTMQGSEWISYLMDENTEITHSSVDKISLHFRTTSGEGVLFYAREHYPQYNHLAVSLHNASIHVSVVFVDADSFNELFVALGSALNDDRWHQLVVTHDGNRVDVHLDGHVERMTADDQLTYLRLPPNIFFGGIEVSAKPLGLRSNVGFVGCLRSVYFNHLNVMGLLNSSDPSVIFHGNGSPLQHGCQDLANSAMQFSHSGTFTKVEHPQSDTLDVRLEFRTLKGHAVLIYSEVVSDIKERTGFLQIALKDGHIEMVIAPVPYEQQSKRTFSVGHELNDNTWHSLVAQVKVDEDLISEELHDVLIIGQASYVGFGPNTNMDFGYIGCMRRVSIQSQVLDPVQVVHSALSAGITLGSCDLTDWCHVLEGPFCHNGGLCVSLWSERHCDCSTTDYVGKFCQFSKLKRSCNELYQSGVTRDGVFRLDLDGAGPLKSVFGYCDMGQEFNRRHYGVTRVQHNLEPGTVVRDPTFDDMKKVLTYRQMQHDHLQTLVANAEFCHQEVEITCSNAPLRMGTQTWLVSGQGKRFTSLGASTKAACKCRDTKTCLDPRYSCNCDAGSNQLMKDEGVISEKEFLPVKELAFLQSLGGSANITLGPLLCYGSVSQQEASVAMFTTEDSYLRLPAWHDGDIRFMFRTTSPTAVLLYQRETKESAHMARLLVMLQDGEYITIHSSRPQLMETVQLNSRLNTGLWQYISMDFGAGQVRVAVNKADFVFELNNDDVGIDAVKEYDEEPLYVGGRPGTNHDFSGMIGCIGGLFYNEKSHMLSELVTGDMQGVQRKCSSACDSHPCANGATCLEMWTDYTCRCSSPFSQTGHNCQNGVQSDSRVYLQCAYIGHREFIKAAFPTDINRDSIQMRTEDSYLSYQLSDFSHDPLFRDLVFSFRTTQARALLLYAHDHMNNFVQLEVKNREELVLTYNSLHEIKEVVVNAPDIANGLWKQIAVFPDLDNSIAIHVDESSSLLSEKRQLLTQYTHDPFAHAESVSPERGLYPDPPALQIFVGSVPDYYDRHIPGLQGCLRGLRIDDKLLNLEGATGRQDHGISAGCNSGCLSSPCANNGLCIDDMSHAGLYSCECSQTAFSGTLCDEDYGLYFDGHSQLTETLSLQSSLGLFATVPSVTISFSIATPDFGDHPRAIAFVRGRTGLSDYILVYLTEMGTAAVQVGIGMEELNLEGSFHLANNKPHTIQVHIREQKIGLKVDDYEYENSFNSPESMTAPSFFTLGGVKKDNYKFENFVNFTGDISNAFLVTDHLEPINARPLDVYYGFPDGNQGISIAGSFHPVNHQIHPGLLYRTGYAGRRMAGNDNTMPPWNSGPALTVTLSQTTPAAVSAGSGDALVIGVPIAIVVLLVVAGLIAFVLYRRWNRKSSFSPERLPGDEEEGLLRLGPVKNGAPADDGKKNGDLPTAKLRQGPRGKRTSQGNSSDDENEETPMLQQMEQNGSSQPNEPNPMKSFGEDMGSVPMIDAVGATGGSADKTPLPETPEKKNLSQTDLENDPSLFAPSPQNTSTPYKSDNAGLKDSPPVSPASSRHSPSRSLASAESYSRLPREVWTESQILSVLDADHNSEEEKEAEAEGNANNNSAINASNDEFFPAEETLKSPDISDTKAHPTNNLPSHLDIPQRGSAYYSSLDSFATAPEGMSSPTLFSTPEVRPSPLMDTLKESTEDSSLNHSDR
ncbi:hypothetical protein CAPTEDRAFT_224303 [Capitella teleta]|uniref:EGF-like domain-containing protein n=1 Tax=Capitella teleta TaxID=283909 RepID=R7TDB6_CAPTE|nr:hypothetical protein CAPTEDRAFT_224303 [Capitella teleta]|eukprot:ELT91728.1 hypothetical protein CAPTEDRAFT_224303 [Capitella teleta]